jgi:hypothetical protein
MLTKKMYGKNCFQKNCIKNCFAQTVSCKPNLLRSFDQHTPKLKLKLKLKLNLTCSDRFTNTIHYTSVGSIRSISTRG